MLFFCLIKYYFQHYVNKRTFSKAYQSVYFSLLNQNGEKTSFYMKKKVNQGFVIFPL